MLPILKSWFRGKALHSPGIDGAQCRRSRKPLKRQFFSFHLTAIPIEQFSSVKPYLSKPCTFFKPIVNHILPQETTFVFDAQSATDAEYNVMFAKQ